MRRRHLDNTFFVFPKRVIPKYRIFLFHTNVSLSQLQSPRNLVLIPPHIEDATHVMAATSTHVSHQKIPNGWIDWHV